jgi:predicted acyltransferase
LSGGWLLGAAGICPVVKRIWTPSWVLFSGGWCLLILAAFYWLVDLKGWKRLAFPLVVVGANSIAAYCSEWFCIGFIDSALKCHLGPDFFGFLGTPYEPFLRGLATLLVIWLMLFAMYRKKIFLRI